VRDKLEEGRGKQFTPGLCPLWEKGRRELQYVLFYYTLAALCVKSLILGSFVQHERFAVKKFLIQYFYIPSPGFYLAFILMIISPAFLFPGAGHVNVLLGVNLLISLIFIVDIWYFKAFGNLATVQLAARSLQRCEVRKQVMGEIRWPHLAFALDIPLLYFLCLKFPSLYSAIPRSIPAFIVLALSCAAFIQIKHYRDDVAKKTGYRLLTWLWAPFATIINASPIAYHYGDILVYLRLCRHSRITPEQRTEIAGWFAAKAEVLPDNEYKGIFKGKNLIFIQVESLENFVLKQRAGTGEICPRLNNLLKNSLYFSNIREQVHDGSSSDADLMANTSLYPVRKYMTFFRYPYNHYLSLPKMLGKMGYQSLAFYPNRLSCFNVGQVYPSLGFEKLVGLNFFDVDETMCHKWLSDGSYFRQLYPVLKNAEQPFYAFLQTQTNHGPWDLPPEYRELNLDEQLDKTKLGGYFESVCYTDKQIGVFLDRLEEDGLLNDTVVVIYGDHCGIHKYNPREIDRMECREDWWYGNGMRVPFIIYHKQLPGKEIPIHGGQIDIMPTVAYLMGIDETEYQASAMGRNLLKTERDFVVLNSGRFIGHKQDEQFKEMAVKGLEISDRILQSDYFKPHPNSCERGDGIC